jgi:hypothetical protein
VSYDLVLRAAVSIAHEGGEAARDASLRTTLTTSVK